MKQIDPDSIKRISQYYDEQVQAEWERLVRNPMEYAITSHLLQQHLPDPPALVVDIGGGPGRYALDLARRGYPVHLLDLSPENIRFANNKAQENHVSFAKAIVFDASQPFPYADNSIDALLLMGPLYHLIEPEDRSKTVAEAYRVLKPGGVIFAAFITMFGALQAVLMYNTQGLAEEWSTMQFGVNNHKLGFTTAWFSRPEEIRALMKPFNCVEMVNCEGFSNNYQEQYKDIDPTLFETWVNLNLEFARSPHTLGAGNHIVYIGKKPHDRS
jgi:ubiquinone/menaquinone biosynthesis C-methylase UbiE